MFHSQQTSLFSLMFYFYLLTFLLVYDNYTGAFVVTFPYIHILYPGLVPPLNYSLILIHSSSESKYNCFGYSLHYS
jgi:hypothetical protein